LPITQATAAASGLSPVKSVDDWLIGVANEK